MFESAWDVEWTQGRSTSCIDLSFHLIVLDSHLIFALLTQVGSRSEFTFADTC